jgi:hypothetical protein
MLPPSRRSYATPLQRVAHGCADVHGGSVQADEDECVASVRVPRLEAVPPSGDSLLRQSKALVEGSPLRRGQPLTPEQGLRRGQPPSPGTASYARTRPAPRAAPSPGDSLLRQSKAHAESGSHRRGQPLVPEQGPTPRAAPTAGDSLHAKGNPPPPDSLHAKSKPSPKAAPPPGTAPSTTIAPTEAPHIALRPR